MKRKGIGYMIEVIIAIITLVVFVLSISVPQQDINWTQFQKELKTKDLALTLKKTGDIQNWVKNRNTGNFKTFSEATINLKVSGTLRNIPPTTQTIGVTTLPRNRLNASLVEVNSSHYCYGDLEEIKTEEPVLRTEKEKHDAHLYFGDTDPQILGGGNGIQDYDTLYVDNKTRCQFSNSEGPFYKEEIFNWGNHTNNYYDFKNANTTHLKYYEADLTHKISTQVNQPVNGIPVNQHFDKIELETYKLSNYNLIILKKPGTIQRLNNKPGLRDKVFNYLKESPILIISDLNSTTVSGSFIQGTGLVQIQQSRSITGPYRANFSNLSRSQRLETLFKAQEGSEDIDSTAITNKGGIDSNRTSNPLEGNNTIESQTEAYSGNPNNHIELVNFRRNFPEVVKGAKLARIDNSTKFNNPDNLKILSATIYWLLDKPISFGSPLPSKTSTTTVGSIDNETYMPYRLNLRWYER